MSGLRVLKRLLASVSIALLLGCAEGGTSGTGAGLTGPADIAPVADAGADQTVFDLVEVSISGSGSDSDGTISSYAWTQTGGTAVTLDGADTDEITFTTPLLSDTEVLTFVLTVTDDDGASHSDSVSVTVNHRDLMGTITEIHSAEMRITEPQVAPDDQARQVTGNRDFAFDLYQTIRSEDTNLFYSPHSISLALAMTYAGARNNTEAQMAEVLHFVLEQDQLHPVFNALDLELTSRGQGAEGADGGVFRLNIVNAIWGQKGYDFLDEFLDTLAMHYGAGLRALDFASDPENSRITINEWVEDQTEDRILDLLPEGLINTSTRLVLTNAIYFNAAWLHPFDTEDTEAGDFHLNDGTTVEVQMMAQEMKGMRHAEGIDYQAVELPYDKDEASAGGRLSMLIIVPDQDKFDFVEQVLDGDMVQTILGQMETKAVDLAMPKFEFGADLGLKQVLNEMGMTDAFDDLLSDFSGINGLTDLAIADVLHKAFVKVDEAGTEAAASTAVMMYPTSIPEFTSLTIDRPFIFLIRDHDTDAILFVGRVLDPTS